jgi:poly(A) polymerase
MEDIFSSPLLRRVIAAIPADAELYLVGGAVRDALLGRRSYDLDFVLPAGALRFARKLADSLGGAYFPLDAEREYARIVLDRDDANKIEGGRIKLDFAAYQGDTLDSDLRLRDFTINAMAISVHPPHTLVDPLGGAADLIAKRLRVCSSQSLNHDPLRVLRAVRQAVDFDLQITPETIQLMRQATGQLGRVSLERIRDEIFRILDGRNPRLSLEILGLIGVLESILPELVKLKGVEQSAPHVYDVWAHTLEVIKKLSAVYATLAFDYETDTASNLMLGLVSVRLGRYRQALQAHLEEQLNPERSLRALVFFSALYHDSGKALTRQLDDEERVRFFGHDQEGERLAVARAQELRLSNLEIERLRLVVRHHMRPFLLGQLDGMPTRRAIYRFFRDTGAAGVDICILSMADMLATYGPNLCQEDWARHLDIVRCLLEAWWEHPQEQVMPPALINGHELMSELDLSPGPGIGQILEAIREAQAVGKVTLRAEALELARGMIESWKK